MPARAYRHIAFTAGGMHVLFGSENIAENNI